MDQGFHQRVIDALRYVQCSEKWTLTDRYIASKLLGDRKECPMTFRTIVCQLIHDPDISEFVKNTSAAEYYDLIMAADESMPPIDRILMAIQQVLGMEGIDRWDGKTVFRQIEDPEIRHFLEQAPPGMYFRFLLVS